MTAGLQIQFWRAPGNIFPWLLCRSGEFLHGKSHPARPTHCQAFVLWTPPYHTYLTNTPGFIDRSRPLGATTAAVAKSCNADTYTSANPKRIFAFIQAILRYRVFSVASALCGLSSKPGLTSADKLVAMEYNRRCTLYRSTWKPVQIIGPERFKLTNWIDDRPFLDPSAAGSSLHRVYVVWYVLRILRSWCGYYPLGDLLLQVCACRHEHAIPSMESIIGSKVSMGEFKLVCINRIGHILAGIITCSAISCIFLKGSAQVLLYEYEYRSRSCKGWYLRIWLWTQNIHLLCTL